MRQLFPYLSIAGALPFLACAYMLVMGYQDIPLLTDAENSPIAVTTVLSAYGIVIASFMAGSHWGTHLSLSQQNQWASKLPVISNIIAIGLWMGFLIQPISDLLMLLVFSFSIMLIVDMNLQREGIITKSYFAIRCLVTALVNLSLIVAIVSL